MDSDIEIVKKAYYALKEKEDERRRLDAFKVNQKLIGSCWKYRNSNGEDDWWLYVRLIAVEREGVVLEQVQPNGGYHGPEIQHQHIWTSSWPFPDGAGGRYIRITRGEYNRGVAPILRSLGMKRLSDG